jgi:pyrroline-5-carboxylate reductase
MHKLGVVGGGAMGAGIISGLIAKEYFNPRQVFLVEPDRAKHDYFRETLRIHIKDSLAELADSCDTLLLAVKPHIMPVVARELSPFLKPDHLLVSIAAGVSLQSLAEWFHDARIVRVMPNTPLRVGRGVSVYCPGEKATAADAEDVTQLFGALGRIIRIPESQFDAATAVSGSGPAYVFYLMEAMIDSGVMLGLGRNDAAMMVAETFAGAVEMMLQTGEHPAKLRNDVTSPGGTTAAALFEMEKNAVSGGIMRALTAAAERSRELGKK